jgi:probable rRNA maturation factor
MSRPNRKSAPIVIVWQAAEPAPRGWMSWLKRLLAGYLAGLRQTEAGVTLLVSGDAALRDLNAAHRGSQRPTDILSFSYLDTPPRQEKTAGRRALIAPRGKRPAVRSPHGTPLGELAVSWDRVRAQARANGWDARTEMARLLAHGCVHLVGYDHATRAGDAEMRRIEERLLKAAGYVGLYP